MLSLISPAQFYLSDCHLNNNQSIEVEIYNAGTDTIIDIPLSYQLNASAILRDTLWGVIAPNSSATKVLSQGIDLSAVQTHTVSVWSELNADQRNSNDTTRIQIETINSSSFTAPYSYEFDAQDLCPTTSNCEQEICMLQDGWLNAENGVYDNIDWRSNEGGTPSPNTGPQTDRSGTGRYLYIEGSAGNGNCINRSAALLSPCIDLDTLVLPRMSLWYNMYGNTMGSLELDIYDGSQWHNNIGPVLQGNQGGAWKKMDLDLFAYQGSVINIRVRAISGNGFETDMAIDDFSIYEGLNINMLVSGPACKDSTLYFEAAGDTNHVNYAWTFGTSATPASASGKGIHAVSFNQLGTQTIRMTTTIGSKSYTVQEEVEIATAPIAGFGQMNTNGTVSFSDASSNATSWFWDFGDGNTSILQNPSHTYANWGRVVIMQIAQNGCASDTLFQQLLITTDMENINDKRAIVYPNPSSTILYFEIEEFKVSVLKLYNSLGQEVFQIEKPKASGTIEVSQFAKGVYQLEFVGENSVIQKSIVIE